MSLMDNANVIEKITRAICLADDRAPDPDAPIYIGMRKCSAWEARTPLTYAALKAIDEAGYVVVLKDVRGHN